MARTWRRFGIFFLLTYLLLALVPLAGAAFSVPSLDFPAMARGASEVTGIGWSSNLVDLVQLAWVEPGLWLLILGSGVPTLAAVVTMAAVQDRQAFVDWLARYNPARLAREISLGSSIAVLAISACIVVGLLLTFEIRQLAWPGVYVRPSSTTALTFAPALVAAAFLDQGAVLEEGGWRGYATPLLQAGLVKPLLAAIVVGAAWGVWHIPRDVVSGVVERLGAIAYMGMYLPSFLLGTIAVSVIAAACSNRMGGSIYPAIFIHGLTNDAVGLSGLATIETALTPAHQITKAVPMLVVAGALMLASQRSLWFKHD